MAHLFTVSNSGNTKYVFKTEEEANKFFDNHQGKKNPLWLFRDAPYKMLREYSPKEPTQ